MKGELMSSMMASLDINFSAVLRYEYLDSGKGVDAWTINAAMVECKG